MQTGEPTDSGASRILIIDDNESIHADFRKVLDARKSGSATLNNAKASLFGAPAEDALRPTYDIDSAHQGELGHSMIAQAVEENRPYAVAFVDMRMPPGWDGVETIEHIWQVDDTIQIVICTAYSDYSWSEIIQRLGNSDRLLILKKPFDNIEVCQLAAALSQKHRLTLESRRRLEDLNLTIKDRTAALSQSESHIGAILESAAECIICANHLGEIIEFNPSAERAFGYSRDDALGKRFAELIIPPSLRVQHDQSFVRCVKLGEVSILGKRLELTAMRRDGSEFPIEITVTSIRREGEQCFTAILHDISDRKDMETRLRYEAMHDSLTSLPNRALFMDRLQHAVAGAQRNTDYEFAVLFIDLDCFKRINDSLGHLTGDQLLIETSERLQTCVRANDTVARLGGDEFAILIDKSVNPQQAVRVARRVNQSLAKPFDIAGNSLYTAASIGIAFGTKSYTQADDILRDADIAMYRAKSQGKGRYELFSFEMHDQARQMLDTENELRRAVDQQEFVNFYQPIVSLRTLQLVAFESLVRWNHPVRGLIQPLEFIPIAEESGLMAPIGWSVLRESLRQVSRWKESRHGNSRPVGVNFSPKHLLEKDLVETVERMLAEFDLSAEDLAIEVTEEAVLEKSSKVSGVLNDLKSMGIRLCIDDFGTGYASLSYLYQFPFDMLKIDRSFLPNSEDNRNNWYIVAAIIELAHNLGMTVVAEGIETQEQCDRLQSLDCDLGQGYLFSRPLPSQEATAFLGRGDVSQTGMWSVDTVSVPTFGDVVNT